MASSPVDETRPLLSSTSDYGANESQATEVDVHVLRDVEYDTIPETSTVGRHLSWSSAYILVVSRVIGSGIFATPGIIVRQVGSIGITLLLFFIGSIIAACGLVVSLEYGCMLPRSGGENVYLEFTYRHPRFLASTLVAVQAVLLGFTASNCIIFGEYIVYACGIEPDERLQKTLALGLLTAITIVHGCFRKTGIIIQNSLGWIKVALALFMGFTGLYVVAFHPDQVPSMRGPQPNSDLWARLWEGSNWGWGIISTAIFKVLYSYAGLTNMNNVLNEVKDPIRTLKTVSVSSLDTACVLYLLVNVAYFLVVPLEEIKARPEVIAALFFDRVFSARVGGTLLPILIASSLAGNVMVVTFALVSSNAPKQNAISNQDTGSFKSRNSPSRIPPIFSPSLLVSTVWCSNGRVDCSLYPFVSRHRFASP